MLRTIAGPAIILYGSQSFYTESPITVKISLETVEKSSSQFGVYSKKVVNKICEISATPIGVWAGGGATFTTRMGLLMPNINSVPGTLLFPATQAAERTLVIWTINDGIKYTWQSVAVTKMPTSITLSTQKTMLGSMTWTALTKLATSTNAVQLWSVADTTEVDSSVSFTDNTFDSGDDLNDRYSAAWGSVTGFTALETVDGFVITPSMSVRPVKADNYGTYNYQLTSIGVTMKCNPIGLDPEDALAAMKIQDTGAALPGTDIGSIQSSNVVISGSASGKPRATLYGAQLVDFQQNFDKESDQRVSDLVFDTSRIFTASATGNLLVVDTVPV
jgi:hypothetical protein